MANIIKCKKVGKNVIVKVVTARQLQLLPIYKGGEIYDDESNLVGINYDDEFSIKVGETVPIKKHRYKIQKITKMTTVKGKHVKGYHLHAAQLSKSSMFMFPFLGYNRSHFRWNSDFMNCFISREGEDLEKGEVNYIYLWYKYVPSIQMEEFEEQLKSNENFVDFEDVDKYHVLYKFSIPDKYKEDCRKIIKGKYSYITEIAKERILDFHFSSKKRPLGKILYRSSERRKKMEKELGIIIPPDVDLHDPFYMEEETFYDKFKIIKPKLGW
jgi:hypothetical protein